MKFPTLSSLWREVTALSNSYPPTGTSNVYKVGDKVSFVCEDEAESAIRTFNITCIGTLGWDVPDPLPLCQAPRPTPDYVVARNNGSFAGSLLQTAEVCDKEFGLGVPFVQRRLDMYQILANVTPVVDGILVPIANNIRKYVYFLVNPKVG